FLKFFFINYLQIILLKFFYIFMQKLRNKSPTKVSIITVFINLIIHLYILLLSNLILETSFIPGSVSNLLFTSTAYRVGILDLKSSACSTLSKSIPPLKKKGLSNLYSFNFFQLNIFPLPPYCLLLESNKK